MSKLYCIKFGYPVKPYYGYIKPWNAVRDEETYSLTYMLPSFFDGLKERFNFHGNIIRHKLTFDLGGMSSEQGVRFVPHPKENLIVKPFKDRWEKGGDKTWGLVKAIHKRHELVNPELILAFDNKEDAEYMLTQCIYFGQDIYTMCPIMFDESFGIKEMTHDEFNELNGVETFLTSKDDPCGFYCGNNRHKNNERMYIQIQRNEW